MSSPAVPLSVSAPAVPTTWFRGSDSYPGHLGRPKAFCATGPARTSSQTSVYRSFDSTCLAYTTPPAGAPGMDAVQVLFDALSAALVGEVKFGSSETSTYPSGRCWLDAGVPTT